MWQGVFHFRIIVSKFRIELKVQDAPLFPNVSNSVRIGHEEAFLEQMCNSQRGALI